MSLSRIFEMLWAVLAVLFVIALDFGPAVLFAVVVYLFASHGDVATALGGMAVLLYRVATK
jgi:hypothetical protein